MLINKIEHHQIRQRFAATVSVSTITVCKDLSNKHSHLYASGVTCLASLLLRGNWKLTEEKQ